jgi:hypothetical protein
VSPVIQIRPVALRRMTDSPGSPQHRPGLCTGVLEATVRDPSRSGPGTKLVYGLIGPIKIGVGGRPDPIFTPARRPPEADGASIKYFDSELFCGLPLRAGTSSTSRPKTQSAPIVSETDPFGRRGLDQFERSRGKLAAVNQFRAGGAPSWVLPPSKNRSGGQMCGRTAAVQLVKTWSDPASTSVKR